MPSPLVMPDVGAPLSFNINYPEPMEANATINHVQMSMIGEASRHAVPVAFLYINNECSVQTGAADSVQRSK